MKFDKKYIPSIVSTISLIALFIFPFVTNDVSGYYAGSLNGFTVALNTYIGFLLIVLPLFLVIAPFNPKYEAKLPKILVVTPPLCIISWLLCVLFSKTFVANLANSTLSAGAYITLACYIVLAVYSLVVYKKELKEMLENLKQKK